MLIFLMAVVRAVGAVLKKNHEEILFIFEQPTENIFF